MAKFELVEIVTKDKLVHQGIFFSPAKPGKKAVLWVHGLTGRFYSEPRFLAVVAQACDEADLGFAVFNNRGHDYVTSTHRLDANDPKGYTYQTIGASVESFTDSIHDIDAGIQFLINQGFTEVVLVGHSTGANKVCYYAAAVDDPRVAGIVLSGPMSDRYSASDEETRQKNLRLVEQKIREGKGDEIMTGLDFLPLTPNRWMSLMGEGSAEDVFNYRDEDGALATYGKIRKPMLVVFGGNDEHADRPISEIKQAFDAHAKTSNYRGLVIPDTDHGFSRKEKEFVSTIVNWVAELP